MEVSNTSMNAASATVAAIDRDLHEVSSLAPVDSRYPLVNSRAVFQRFVALPYRFYNQSRWSRRNTSTVSCESKCMSLGSQTLVFQFMQNLRAGCIPLRLSCVYL